MNITHIKKPHDVWGARWGKYPGSKHMNNTEPLEKGWLGNPYVIGPDGSREEVIKKFAVDFYDKVENDPDFRKAILGLKDKTVGCFCDPNPCHLGIIRDYIKNQKSD